MTEMDYIPPEALPKDLNGRQARLLTGALAGSGYLTVDLPSGVGSVDIKSMRTADENLFHQDNRKDPLRPFNTILARCVKGLPTRKLGKMNDAEPQVDWRKVWNDDYAFMLYVIRRLTYGDIFKFKFRCPQCAQETEWHEDLATTPILYASEEMKSHFNSANPRIEYMLPISGKKAVYRPMTAKDQEMLIGISRDQREKAKTESIRIRMVDLGEKGACHDKDMENLPPADFNRLMKNMVSQEVGVYTKTHATCIHCNSSVNIRLPIDSESFLASVSEVIERENGTLSTLWESPAVKQSDTKNYSLPSNGKEPGQT